MEDEIFHLMFELDSSHWWFYGQRAWLRQFYLKFAGQEKKWLDVGCGVGDVLRNLRKDFVGFGIDKNDLALSYCKRRNILRLVKGSVASLPFKDESFDFVSVLGVMYHRGVENDRLCVKESVRVCRKGGLLFFSEPVTFLKGKHDIKEHTTRRYSSGTLKELILASGLKIDRISYFCFFAFVPIFLIRKLERFWPGREKDSGGDLKTPSAFINLVMILLMRLESVWVKYFPLPIGSSVICVARKL